MTIEMFIRLFPMVAVRMNIGFTTTVQHEGKAYSFKKLDTNVFERTM